MALKKGHQKQNRISKKGYSRLKENLKGAKSRKPALEGETEVVQSV